MSKLMDEFREQIHGYTGPSVLSRQRIEQIKETIPDVMFCVSCNEELPKGHHIGDRDINGVWEPFCSECFAVTKAIQKFEEEEEDESSWRNRNV